MTQWHWGSTFIFCSSLSRHVSVLKSTAFKYRLESMHVHVQTLIFVLFFNVRLAGMLWLGSCHITWHVKFTFPQNLTVLERQEKIADGKSKQGLLDFRDSMRTYNMLPLRAKHLMESQGNFLSFKLVNYFCLT